jgi:hypothetical protein
MAYSTSNPPYILAQPYGHSSLKPALWAYSSTDAVTVVRVTGYFTNAKDLGMKAGDLVLVLDNDASPLTGSWCWVSVINANGSADLSDGVTITGTNTD